jgi:hypothetical protein
MHPVAQSLAVHAAQFRRLAPRTPLQRQRNRQKPTDLGTVFAPASKSAKFCRRMIATRNLKCLAHPMLPCESSTGQVNQITRLLGTPAESPSRPIGIIQCLSKADTQICEMTHPEYG